MLFPVTKIRKTHLYQLVSLDRNLSSGLSLHNSQSSEILSRRKPWARTMQRPKSLPPQLAFETSRRDHLYGEHASGDVLRTKPQFTSCGAIGAPGPSA